MNITISYNKFKIESLAAVAVGCSKNVVIKQFEEKNNSLIVSMAPSCEKIKSRTAIILLILNINPLEVDISENLFWYENFVKPVIYQYLKSPKSKSDENATQIILNNLELKYGASLKNQLGPLELILWSDLLLFFMDKSSYQVKMPAQLCQWFGEFNKFEYLQRAANLVLGDIKTNLQEIVEKLASYPIRNVSQASAESVVTMPENVNSQELDEIKNDFLNGFSKVSLPPVFQSPKLPIKNGRNILITSALPYVNNVPHLGNLIGSTLSADVFSRFCRLRGHNSLYVCGTDEYGTTTEVKASEEKTTPRLICDHYSAIHAEIYKWFNIDFDIFGRTSTPLHTEIVTEVFEQIHEKGFMLEDTVTQLYCTACDKFLADRLVEGVCPLCSYEDARGDQCDKCGKLINAVDLKTPRCKLCGAAPIIRTSKHLFLDLTNIQANLETYLHDTMSAPDSVWSTNAKSITRSWLNEGLKPRCITRDLKWGVPVPLAGYDGKVFYVWFDAVLGYLSITAAYTRHWRQWWQPQEVSMEMSSEPGRQTGTSPVELYQFMAKDNVPFHSVILPANLMATGRQWTTVRQLVSTEYLNYENDKFSKSRGIGVFGTDAKSSGIDADIWRFYLVSCRPESQDSSFSWDEFATRNNSELLNNLGNFVYRALSFVVRFYDGLLPDLEAAFIEEDVQLVADVNVLVTKYVVAMDTMRMRDALYTVLAVSHLGNGYMQHNKPWAALKVPHTVARAGTVISVAANIAVLLAVMLAPIMPDTSDRILRQCNAPANSKWIPDDYSLKAFLRTGHQIGPVDHLFKKMEPEFVQEMKKKFSSAK